MTKLIAIAITLCVLAGCAYADDTITYQKWIDAIVQANARTDTATYYTLTDTEATLYYWTTHLYKGNIELDYDYTKVNFLNNLDTDIYIYIPKTLAYEYVSESETETIYRVRNKCKTCGK